MRNLLLFLLLSFLVAGCGGAVKNTNTQDDKVTKFREKIKHIVIIYQENWSFDGLYGKFPGADNLDSAGARYRQYNAAGQPLDSFPHPLTGGLNEIKDPHFHCNLLPPHPYNLMDYLTSDSIMTGDLVHRYYTERKQIDGGKMDKFVVYSDNGGLVQSYFDASDLPEGKLARQYTMCDHFFHSAYGGSFLNHIWLVAAASPKWDTKQKPIPAQIIMKNNDDSKQITTDGYAVNTTFTDNKLFTFPVIDTLLRMPPLNMPTIGDRLTEAGHSWAWFSGKWNEALDSFRNKKSLKDFQYHHQPFTYFSKFNNADSMKKYLKDETEFEQIFGKEANAVFPEVCFVKAFGTENEHPGYANLRDGQNHVKAIVDAIMNSKYKDETVIIIAYDENGGRWDHVKPPVRPDGMGCGTRVPAIVISKYALKGKVDHTEYETASILKLIEKRFDLKYLTARDSAANDMLNAFDFQ